MAAGVVGADADAGALGLGVGIALGIALAGALGIALALGALGVVDVAATGAALGVTLGMALAGALALALALATGVCRTVRSFTPMRSRCVHVTPPVAPRATRAASAIFQPPPRRRTGTVLLRSACGLASATLDVAAGAGVPTGGGSCEGCGPLAIDGLDSAAGGGADGAALASVTRGPDARGGDADAT